ncbi:MAG TPA: glycerol-3-phosphate dehydrogenase [Burkholderiales bacterium]|nr:glycerol-3-phosphate dehydrogenase [Burkholderiales bacterium]
MEHFDLFIIGGGINGSGIARDAAGRGLEVGLVEQGDFGGATSSASSKLIHGGLRYLEHFEFRLVAESLAERRLLLNRAAHLIKPLEFVLPEAPGLRPAWMIRAGLWFYDRLGGRGALPHSEAICLHGTPHAAGLKPDLKRGFKYWDAWVDDARLVIANLRSAAYLGARLMSRTRFVQARATGGLWEVCYEGRDGEQRRCSARILVNAGGPWVAQVLQGVETATQAPIRLVKGSHIVVPRVHEAPHAYILQNADKRVLFILPFEKKFSLIGTTEVVLDSPTLETQISAAEIRYLIDAANVYLEKPLSEEAIRWTYSGVRPLYDDGDRNASAVTRDYTLQLQVQSGAPLLNVYGGKITTYRTLAEAALHKLSPWLNAKRGPWTADESLPGSNFQVDARNEREEFIAQYPNLPLAALNGIFDRHGTESAAVLGDIRSADDLGRNFGADLYECEARYFIEHEWAEQSEDILWRRSKAGLHMDEAQRQVFETWFSQQ